MPIVEVSLYPFAGGLWVAHLEEPIEASATGHSQEGAVRALLELYPELRDVLLVIRPLYA